jgi:hypothetical protein
MTIIVKKPFSFEDVKVKVIVKEHDTVDNVEQVQVHPEFEEKPVVESTTQTSEDVHGGSELTFSLPNSSQSQENGNNRANQDTQGNTSASNNADTNNANVADNGGVQEQQNAGGEKSNDNNETKDEVDKQSNESGTNDTQESQSTTNDVDTQFQDGNDESGSNVNNQDGDSNADSTSVTDNETKQGQENDGDEVGDTQEQGNEQNSENDEESESEDADEQSQSGTYNTQQVVDVVNAVSASKYYQTEFWRFIEMIAEEKTRTFDPMGSDEYNVKKLLFRQYERKPLSSYKMSRVKESVVILLDNSGSMQWWADNLQILADLAMQRNDVEVYLAPNGHIEEMLYPKNQLVNHDDVVRRLRNRKIIYVGDFDGADTPIMLSWYNDVVWICPEERYLNFLEHDWVHYDETKFKGAFLRVFTLQELFGAFKKLLSTPALKIWYDLCNETRKCGGDAE